MTELKWLIDMLMNQKMSSSLKDRFIARIGEVEAGLVQSPAPRVNRVQQAIDQAYAAVPAQDVAQTAKAQAAIQDRQKAISIAASGVSEPGRTSPRKF